MRRFHIALFCLWVAGILGVVYGSLWSEWRLPSEHFTDKGMHLAAYAALAVIPASIGQTRLSRVLCLALLFVVGGAIELLQPLANRDASTLDQLANSIGIFVGAIVARLLRAGHANVVKGSSVSLM